MLCFYPTQYFAFIQHDALLLCWRAAETGKRSFFLLIVIKSRATVTSAKLISLFTKMAKRKMDNRSFQYRWEADYLLPKIKDRPVCLVCEANVAVTKEYETKHCEK